MQYIRIFLVWMLFVWIVPGFCGVIQPVQAQTTDSEPPQATDAEEAIETEEESAIPLDTPTRNYLFVHDTSKNMRRKKRIAMMQDTIRSVLANLPQTSRAGFLAFGHRFSLDGPDFCTDSEIVLPFEPINVNKEDIDAQLNLLSDPQIGGGAPVGLALRQGFEALAKFEEPKEIFFNLVDLQECPNDQALAAIYSACEVEDLHLTLIGIGLKRDYKTLQEAKVEQLGCVDVINITTPDEAEQLPNRLLTRLSLQFKNAEGELVDPQPGEELQFTLSRQDEDGDIDVVRKKFKDATVKGSSLETVALEEGNYLLDLEYQGRKLRSQKAITITDKHETREIFYLGKMLIEVTDFSGEQLEAGLVDDLKITLFDADVPIRNVERQNTAEFDLLPGEQYKVQVRYTLGGEPQTVEAESLISIKEGNHKNVSIPLPVGSLSGRIVDMNGQPAPKVEVLLSTEDGRQIKSPRFTDQNGRYSFQDLDNGLYRLYLKKAGYKEDMRPIIVVGGRKNRIEDLALFRGIEIQVSSISGDLIDDAEVTLIHKDSGEHIPVDQRANIYRNVKEIQPGDYLVSVTRDGYESASREIRYADEPPFIDVPFLLPYYVTISGHIINAKQEGVPDAQLEFYSQYSSPVLSEGQDTISSSSDGTFQVQLSVKKIDRQQLRVVWYDSYNQRYSKDLEFSLPEGPQELKLGKILLPINFLQLSLTSILGKTINADSLLLTHQQSGQTGIRLHAGEHVQYESLALLDGDYSLRVIKKGYQDVERQFSVQGGNLHHIPLTLHNYVTISGTVTDGKQNRVSNASIEIAEKSSTLTTSQSIVTGKDGRFQTTLLVNTPAKEEIHISWKSPESGKEYHISREFELSGLPIEEFKPHNLGDYQLPANFMRVEVQDVFGRGLPGVDVQFISRQGDITSAIELGDGIYESLDLYDGYYNITFTKSGYKENILLSDIAVGRNKRNLDAGQVELPHYATITGTVFNGKYEGMPNVELFFGNKASEQLESCRTNQHGRFSTTLLVTGPGKEQWKASWEEADNFSSSGVFTLPARPHDVLNIGEIRLPVNFVSIPIQDIRGKVLSEVKLEVSALDEQENKQFQRFHIEEIDPGLYQIQNLPNGRYRVTFERSGYELGKTIEIDLQGGENLRQPPVQLGYYMTIVGKTINGRSEAVPHASVRFKALHSTLQPSSPSKAPSEQTEESDEEEPSPSLGAIETDRRGRFTARLLVTSPGIEELESDWGGKFLSSFQLDLSDGPGIQHITLKLPINFITVNVRDIAGESLSGARVTLEPQSGDQLFLLKEQEAGVYQSTGIPDGSYAVQVNKEQYKSRSTLINVQTGESRQASFDLYHYVTVKGQVLDGKREGISAAVIAFANLKTETNEKIFSGTDGAFETQVLVKDLGRESGKISWDGKNGSYQIPFLIDLPPAPGEIILPKEQTVLPINYVSIEVKSVAATGIAGATVQLINQTTGRSIEARDNKNGNYSGEEIPNGIYNIRVTKDKYRSVTLPDVHLEGGVYKSDLSVPRFSHYITLSGLVMNGKRQGVPDAIISIKEPKGLQEVSPFTTRDDGSFTLHALVTDVGSETLEAVWDETYRTSLQIKLPLLPEDVQLKNIRLPINFISVNVQDIYGKAISGAEVSFAQRHNGLPAGNPLEPEDLAGIDPASPLFFAGRELTEGLYESPELPDNDYLIIVTKKGYVQEDYPELSVSAGVNISAKPLSMPHVITITGRVVNGKGEGVSGTAITIAENSSERSNHYLESGESGYFSESLQITGRDKENLSLLKEGSVAQQERRFSLSQDFMPQKEPGEQNFGDLRLPINFVPIQVYDVANRPINDATITVSSLNPRQRRIDEGTFQAVHLGEGKYEVRNLNDGNYLVSVEKDGYKTQEANITLSGGEVAPEITFELPHYVYVEGIVTTGKGDGLSDAILEFAQENSQLLLLQDSQKGQGEISSISTDVDGQFTAKLLVTGSGEQVVEATWNSIYSKKFSFPLPDKPDFNHTLDTEVRLPINFAPFRITNILEQGLAGVDITLQKMGAPPSDPLLASPLGDGYYEARELLDGAYLMTVHKDGYQEVTGNFSVNGGEQSPEQHFSLPHYVSIIGKIVNGKGLGIQGATIRLEGMSSSLLKPDETLKTKADGGFQLDLLVNSDTKDLKEHLDISWSEHDSDDSLVFTKSYDFLLPTEPRIVNLGALALPANFFPVLVKDVSDKSLAGATVTFIDEHGKKFLAKEISDGYYEGQNLPDGIYTVQAQKEDYKTDKSDKIQIASTPETSNSDSAESLSFSLPYYVDIRGTSIDGKGQTLSSGITLSLASQSSQLLKDSITFEQDGSFHARLLVTHRGQEQLHLAWQGEHGVHARDISFTLPDAPQLVDLQRLSLPINFIPVEVKDLQGYGLAGATVRLYHVESESTMNATDLGDGQYEGQNLPDGSYEISVTKDGYKASEHILVSVAEGFVSEKRSFMLRHYVNITGIATNGNGEGVSDPVIEVEKQRSEVSQVSSEVSGEFELKLEVKEVGNERIYLDWKHEYRLPLIFKLPERPETKDLGEIRLPINFLSIFSSDISGSTLPEVTVLVEEPNIGFSQLLKTDKNGFCRTDELPNGHYEVSLSKRGYQPASRKVQLYDGRNMTLRFTLPHYVIIKGRVIDVMDNAVGAADIIFDEFFDANYQKIRAFTDSENGQFEQQLLIDDPAFLERQKGHFSISKRGLKQEFTFKIPPQPEQVIHYKTLLFPISYLNGKVVDTDIQTVPITDARVSLTPVSPQLFTGPPRKNGGASDSSSLVEITTDSLGEFTVSHLAPGEYKISIQKDGYQTYEDFIRISSLLQDQEFALRRAE